MGVPVWLVAIVGCAGFLLKGARIRGWLAEPGDPGQAQQVWGGTLRGLSLR